MTIRIASFVFLAFSLQAAHLVYQTPISAFLVATDSSGNAYVLGNSGIAKLDPTGNVIYSNVLPAMGTQSAIAVDAAGNIGNFATISKQSVSSQEGPVSARCLFLTFANPTRVMVSDGIFPASSG